MVRIGKIGIGKITRKIMVGDPIILTIETRIPHTYRENSNFWRNQNSNGSLTSNGTNKGKSGSGSEHGNCLMSTSRVGNQQM